MENEKFDCLIIGSGPAGIGAAISLVGSGIHYAVIDGSTPGGKVNVAPRVDNYPGFTKIPGPDLAYELYKRLKNSGSTFIREMVTSLTKEGDGFKVVTEQNTYAAKTVLLASGTKERKLGFPREDELLGHGISYCAICDGHFFKDKDVIVIGGGNSALKEAIYLTDLCHHVTLIHRRNEFRGNDRLVTELKAHQNVTVLTPYIPLEFIAEDEVKGIKIQNVETKEVTELKLDGIFPLVGQIPNTQYIEIEGVKNEWNTVPVDMKTMMTHCPGLFASGDILPRDIRQIYLAEHDGKVAAKAILAYLGK